MRWRRRGRARRSCGKGSPRAARWCACSARAAWRSLHWIPSHKQPEHLALARSGHRVTVQAGCPATLPRPAPARHRPARALGHDAIAEEAVIMSATAAVSSMNRVGWVPPSSTSRPRGRSAASARGTARGIWLIPVPCCTSVGAVTAGPLVSVCSNPGSARWRAGP